MRRRCASRWAHVVALPTRGRRDGPGSRPLRHTHARQRSPWSLISRREAAISDISAALLAKDLSLLTAALNTTPTLATDSAPRGLARCRSQCCEAALLRPAALEARGLQAARAGDRATAMGSAQRHDRYHLDVRQKHGKPRSSTHAKTPLSHPRAS